MIVESFVIMGHRQARVRGAEGWAAIRIVLRRAIPCGLPGAAAGIPVNPRSCRLAIAMLVFTVPGDRPA